MAKQKLSIALLCGGPSLERGISLNSARSVCDHLRSDDMQIVPIYFAPDKQAHQVSEGQLYSNTPSDFDFKLASAGKALTQANLKKLLKSVDLVFPAMHGAFGEDGEVQKYLEDIGCPFIGAPSKACKVAFDKHLSNQHIKKAGFNTIPSLLLTKHGKNSLQKIKEFFGAHDLKQAVVKPATSGSSIAVYRVHSISEALESAKTIFRDKVDTRVVVEPFCEGKEFTVIILENKFGMPVAILPTEIELDYHDYEIFDYRKKYLATKQVTYHCPPRFDEDICERIQIHAEQIFHLFGMKDYARFDGWLFPDGEICFSDFNPVSGMEQNSFLFMQSARIGMSHRDVLRYIVRNTCRRYGLPLPQLKNPHQERTKQTRVNVLFGGKTAERQVSLMSGTNVWLKLRSSKKYSPEPYLLDAEQNVWHLPYAFALNHTVEEVTLMCKSALQDEDRLRHLKTRVLNKLSPELGEVSEEWQVPEKTTLQEFIKNSPNVFIALHGGIGENGQLQKSLEKELIPFNGSSSSASSLCMNKYLTGQVVEGLQNQGISSAKKLQVLLEKLTNLSTEKIQCYWRELTEALDSETIIAKPLDDGCSAGVARLFSAEDLQTYCHFASTSASFIPEGTLKEQTGIIEMPPYPMKKLLFETFLETDLLRVIGKELKWKPRTDWVEITVGVFEKNKKLHAMNPSITVATGDVLSLEEKFQGGTGVNITPPPASHVSPLVLKRVRKHIIKVAEALGIQGYARIDCFMNRKNGDIIVIEANTLPGLTAATVIFHQAFTEKPPLYPTAFLEKIVESAEIRYQQNHIQRDLPLSKTL